MASEQALALWKLFKDGPKQVDLALPERREAGEHAEDPTAEPTGVSVRDAPEVKGIWAEPTSATEGRTVLYLFGGGYVRSPMIGAWVRDRTTAD